MNIIDNYLMNINKYNEIIADGEKRRKALLEELAETESLMSDSRSKVYRAENHVFTARIGDFVKHLAGVWGTSVDNVQISHYTNCRDFVPAFRKNFDKENARNNVKVSYVFARNDLDPVEKAKSMITIKRKIDLNEVQADGKQMRDHLIVCEPHAAGVFGDVGFNNGYDNLIITAKAKELIINGGYCHSDFAKAMIGAVKDYENREMNQDNRELED